MGTGLRGGEGGFRRHGGRPETNRKAGFRQRRRQRRRRGGRRAGSWSALYLGVKHRQSCCSSSSDPRGLIVAIPGEDLGEGGGGGGGGGALGFRGGRGRERERERETARCGATMLRDRWWTVRWSGFARRERRGWGPDVSGFWLGVGPTWVN